MKKKRTVRNRSRGLRTQTISREEPTTLDQESEERSSYRPASKYQAPGEVSTPAQATPKPKPCEPEIQNHLLAFLERLMKSNIEGLKKEYAELKAYVPPQHSHAICSANRSRNRYSDQYCYDHSRVKLTYNVPPETDYIHANVIQFKEVGHPIILTQGPLPDTVGDFWRMIYQEKCAGIIMLCKTVELKKVKCEQYYPEAVGGVSTYNTLTVKNAATVLEDPHFKIIKLEIGKNGTPFKAEHSTKLYIWKDWQDKFVPRTCVSVLRMLRTVNSDAKTNPVVVHCSAGVGRTGTVVALAAIMQKIYAKQPFNVFETVKELRGRRYNAVQTDLQYIYIHRVLCDYIKIKIPEKTAQVGLFINEYNAYLMTQKPPT
ncbi:unnamed protein product [Bursaphelenchus okinawaensis]|uniref:Uncharacterized protein n=1 Tax=Bursaphelenchus okinawaensis TaxID=465554 RepID=A0A811L684_9BILA|nr:unnamed protein product [Bursaphelenchus okinawaensis]CAG9118807.1 unnamed protein product [Bursaphelenchus okinawaensis]